MSHTKRFIWSLLIKESFIAVCALILFLKFIRLKLSFTEYFVLFLVFFNVVQSITSYFFGLPFYRQYPENSKRSISKNRFLRFLIMLSSFIIAALVIYVVTHESNGLVYF
jgi:hypothetical protein